MSRGRRIKLDLSDFVKDVGAHRWMFIKPESFSTISDVVERLRGEYQQLGESDLVTLFLEDFSLPAWETVELLQDGDLVRVCRTQPRVPSNSGRVTSTPSSSSRKVTTTASSKRPQKKPESSSSSSSSESSSEDEPSKPQPPAKSKVIPVTKKKPVETSSSSESSSDSSSESEDSGIKTKAVSVKSTTKPRESSSDSSDSSDSDEDDRNTKKSVLTNQPTPVVETVAPKSASMFAMPKRKRKRKNKNKNKLAPEEIPVFEADIQPPSYDLNSHKMNNSHVTFDNQMDVDEDQVNQQSTGFTEEDVRKLYQQSVSSKPPVKVAPTANKVQLSRVGANSNTTNTGNGCEAALLQQFDARKVTNTQVVSSSTPKIVFKPRVLSVKEMSVKTTRKEPLTFSNGAGDGGGVVAGAGVNTGAVPTTNTDKSNDVSNSNKEAEKLSEFSALLTCGGEVFDRDSGPAKDYTAFHLVSSSGPRVGDIIAFKHIEMSENYSPEVSQYKEGKVIQVDENQSVVFEMITKSKVKKNGRFEMEDDESLDDEKVKTFSWNELIEPRLMFP